MPALAKDRQAFVDTCQNLGIDYHVLERRAIDNYLPTHAIRAVKGEKYSQLGHYQALGSRQNDWGKHENWKIAGEMKTEDLDGTDLGSFLAKLALSVSS